MSKAKWWFIAVIMICVCAVNGNAQTLFSPAMSPGDRAIGIQFGQLTEDYKGEVHISEYVNDELVYDARIPTGDAEFKWQVLSGHATWGRAFAQIGVVPRAYS